MKTAFLLMLMSMSLGAGCVSPSPVAPPKDDSTLPLEQRLDWLRVHPNEKMGVEIENIPVTFFVSNGVVTMDFPYVDLREPSAYVKEKQLMISGGTQFANWEKGKRVWMLFRSNEPATVIRDAQRMLESLK